MKDAKYVFIEAFLFFLSLRFIYFILENIKLQFNPLIVAVVFMIIWALGRMTISRKLLNKNYKNESGLNLTHFYNLIYILFYSVTNA